MSRERKYTNQFTHQFVAHPIFGTAFPGMNWADRTKKGNNKKTHNQIVSNRRKNVGTRRVIFSPHLVNLKIMTASLGYARRSLFYFGVFE